MSNRPTLQQVASEAGCSTAAVSTILNGGISSIRYSDDLAERVRHAARSLNYRSRRKRPDPVQARKVGIVMHDFNMKSEMEMSFKRELTRQLDRCGFAQQILFTDDEFHASCLRERIGRGDLTAAVSLASGPDHCLQDFTKAGLPLVLTNPYELVPENAIVPDEAQGVQQAVQLLCLMGCKRILFAGHRTPHFSGKLRQECLQRECQAAGMSIVGEMNQLSLNARELKDRLDLEPQVIVTYNNMVAHDCLNLLDLLGLEVPRDVGLISLAGLCQDRKVPQVTCVETPFPEMGRLAADMCVDMVKNSQVSFNTIYVPQRIHFNSSLARLG